MNLSSKKRREMMDKVIASNIWSCSFVGYLGGVVEGLQRSKDI